MTVYEAMEPHFLDCALCRTFQPCAVAVDLRKQIDAAQEAESRALWPTRQQIDEHAQQLADANRFYCLVIRKIGDPEWAEHVLDPDCYHLYGIPVGYQEVRRLTSAEYLERENRRNGWLRVSPPSVETVKQMLYDPGATDTGSGG